MRPCGQLEDCPGAVGLCLLTARRRQRQRWHQRLPALARGPRGECMVQRRPGAPVESSPRSAGLQQCIHSRGCMLRCANHERSEAVLVTRVHVRARAGKQSHHLSRSIQAVHRVVQRLLARVVHCVVRCMYLQQRCSSSHMALRSSNHERRATPMVRKVNSRTAHDDLRHQTAEVQLRSYVQRRAAIKWSCRLKIVVPVLDTPWSCSSVLLQQAVAGDYPQ
mmetsp:Transcript_90594/g.293249  ORF Transcript_90594/g.293249 Transcript_90594/m.293249 type:complete len:221 (+) Transcript_90594:362-1024(+)